MRRIALEVFRHLHALSLRFHLERQTGALTRDLERGTRAIGSLINFTLYSIAPTLVEISLVLAILFARYEPAFGAITLDGLTLDLARDAQGRLNLARLAVQDSAAPPAAPSPAAS